jgi:hypothetical protein
LLDVIAADHAGRRLVDLQRQLPPRPRPFGLEDEGLKP